VEGVDRGTTLAGGFLVSGRPEAGHQVLNEIELQEIAFFNKACIQCAIAGIRRKV
jgi:hypothetical protein